MSESARSIRCFNCWLGPPDCVRPPHNDIQAAAQALLKVWSSGIPHGLFNPSWLRTKRISYGFPIVLLTRSSVLWALFEMANQGYVGSFQVEPSGAEDFWKSEVKFGMAELVAWNSAPSELRGPVPTSEFLLFRIEPGCWSAWRAGALNLTEPAGSDDPVGVPAESEKPATSDQPAGSTKDVRPKKSTVKGEARAKLIAAMTKYHEYAKGGCLNMEPVGNNELARLAEVDKATASAFFKQQFKGYEKYKRDCADAAKLVAQLKLLNGDFSPHHLHGGNPDHRDDD